MSFCQGLLKSKLTQAKNKNALYSMRAFSLALGISPSLLSNLMAGKKKLTSNQALNLIKKLNLKDEESKELLCEVDPSLSFLVNDVVNDKDFTMLKEDEFKLISDWHCFAILNLCKLIDNKASLYWISKKLGIKKEIAAEALHRLIRLKLVDVKNNKLVRICTNIKTTHNISSEAIQINHRQQIQNAMRKLETVPVDKRNYTSITMAINPKNLAKAEKLIHEFKLKLCEVLEPGPKTEVYTLAVQLFPLTLNGDEE